METRRIILRNPTDKSSLAFLVTRDTPMGDISVIITVADIEKLADAKMFKIGRAHV